MTQTRSAPSSTAPRRRTGVIIGIAVVALAVAGVAWRFAPDIAPWLAARGYCDDLAHQRYAAIYQQRLTAAERAQISQDAFSAAMALADQQAGKVQKCDVAPLTVSVQGSDAQAQVTEQRNNGLAVRTALQMRAPDWRLAALPDPAIAPYAVAYRYCAALRAQDYAQVYQTFAPPISQQLAQADFVTYAQLADQSQGPVDACAITHLALAQQSATASVQVHRQHGDPAGASVQIQLAQQPDATWLIAKLPNA